VSQPLKVEPGKKVHLKDFNPAYTGKFDHKDEVAEEIAEHVAALDDLSYRLYGEHRRALLIVLQGLDTSGKDGTVRHVMNGVSPLNSTVVAFKRPTQQELDHDFLWRVHRACPTRGHITIFNRSHYEDVLIVRVHKLVEKSVWKPRYDAINAFEKLLTDEGTTVLKFFLHIGKDEQRKRLQARLDDPKKCWKFELGDIEERRYWDDYIDAYEDCLARCSTDVAPWYIVPSNHKWYRDLVVARVLRETLEKMDPQFPPADKRLEKIKVE
jgi:PPK2 family polyphosphate:nucleotide phosphotransferase